MLCNARIRDCKRRCRENERRTGWKVKMEQSSPAAKLTWYGSGDLKQISSCRSPRVSPFSQLILSERQTSPSIFHQFSSPGPPHDSSLESLTAASLESLTAAINGCSLHDGLGSGQTSTAPSLHISPSPAQLERVEGLLRRSLKELNSPAAEDTRHGHQSSATKDRVMLTPGHLQSITPTTHPADSPHIHSSVLHYLSPAHSLPLSPRTKVLTLCDQTHPLPLQNFFTDNMVKSASKLGEGTFAEVFGCTTDAGKSLAIKIIPIEGSTPYNNEPQTTYQDVLTEMAIMKELSLIGDEWVKENRLRANYTENFIQIQRFAVCKGKYPAFLLDVWDTYNEAYNSENSRPDIFPENQLYVLMATENAGVALEDHKFSSVKEALSVVGQVAGALAVGEAALEMEHRDLHTSNILVKPTSQDSFLFRVNGRDISIPSHGIKATIVDYTLSRMKQDDCVLFNDLDQLPWLFEGEGDIQFKVYREMRMATDSKWDQFFPLTNVLWLTYLLTKLSDSATYSDAVSTRSWRAGLRPLLRNISSFSCAQDAFLDLFCDHVHECCKRQ